ncbi:hypothetical protein ACFO4P_17055 [Epilithonimonas pallida]|uniref:Phage portal protein n=1 Tax=Epilithonimonas pallida TaxID=373671 RepID=A0ABY1R822_9FLAO|nr:hypothetical protein [Epilithonimonas pallida]SMP94697.1 hypothetical protein SAMN05421679_10696 [Epilithonimonas pallida]
MIELENDAIVGDQNLAFTFEVLDQNPREKSNSTNPWSPVDIFSQRPMVSRYGDWNVFPYGEMNQLPNMLRNVIYSNSIVPGQLFQKNGLFWGQGPKLYRESIVDNTIVRENIEDPEIEAWLETWDWEKYLQKCTADFSVIESCYTKFVNKKGWRIGSNLQISYLEHVAPNKPLVVGKLQTPTHIIMHRPDYPEIYDVYELFDKFQPFKSGISIHYANLYTFCSDFFSIPQILGSVPWIIQSSNVPKFFEALSKNSVNIKYHITSPMAFWTSVEDKLKNDCIDQNKTYKKSMLTAYKKKLLTQIQKVLSSYENAGKFWHSEQVLQEIGGSMVEQGWKITKIEQNMAETVSAQINIATKADKSVAVGMGIDSAIGGVTEQGRSGSGSEKYYAVNNFYQIGIDLPEMVIFEAMNAAIKINFPEKKKIKMGFYREQPKMQQDMSPQDRGYKAKG